LSDEYSRTHPVRVCRNLCAEAGYSGMEFHECVKKCVEEYLSKR